MYTSLIPSNKITRDIAEKIVIDTCTAQGLNKLNSFIVFSQGLQESGYFSHVFLADFNAFGMKMPHTRKSPYIAGKGVSAPSNESFPNDPYNFYAHYLSLEDSVLDLLDRQRCFGLDWSTIKTPQDYIVFCTHTKYFQGSAAIYASNVAHLAAKYGIV